MYSNNYLLLLGEFFAVLHNWVEVIVPLLEILLVDIVFRYSMEAVAKVAFLIHFPCNVIMQEDAFICFSGPIEIAGDVSW